jgi:hypothetical protein
VTDAARLDLPRARADALLARIASDASPVGIDARETHLLILHLLLDVQERLDGIEARLDSATLATTPAVASATAPASVSHSSTPFQP